MDKKGNSSVNGCKRRDKKRFPWIYVPTTYFAEGVPYVIVNTVSVIIYSRMGMPNSLIGLTSFLYLPWVIKMFWGPLVDTRSTKRTWIISTQLAMAAGFGIAAAVMQSSLFFGLSLAVFTAVAFFSATNDIATDGFYMLALSTREQALYVGVRNLFYRVAMIFTSGGLVVLAGILERRTGDIPMSWTVVLGIAGAVFLGLALFHRFYLPRPAGDAGRSQESIIREGTAWGAVFRSYFSQPKIVPIVAFILLYRLGEAMLVKMALPFLLHPPERGGLGMSTESVGFVYGTVGVLCLIVGGILGGYLIYRFGFRLCIWPMVIALNAPDLAYVYLAWARPPIGYVYLLVALEQFGYGLGFTAFMVFLMYIAKEPYKTSHYAISTGIMALGMMLPGMVSGYLQESLGYLNFFIAVCFLTLPGMLTIFFIPKEES